MAEQKRQQGRPKKQPEKVVESAKPTEYKQKKVESNITPTKDGLIEKSIGVKEKVIEVTTKKVQSRKELPKEVRKKTFEIFIRGKSREVSRATYEAVVKDPKLNVILPKGSPLAVNLKAPEKPCEDC